MEGIPGRRKTARFEMESMRGLNHAVVHVSTIQARLVIDTIGYVIVVATHRNPGRITWYGTYRSAYRETGRDSPDGNSAGSGSVISVPSPVNGDGGSTISPLGIGTLGPSDSDTTLRTYGSPVARGSSNRRTALRSSGHASPRRAFSSNPTPRSFNGNATARAFGNCTAARAAGISATPAETAAAESTTTTPAEAAASGVSLLQ